MGKENSDSSIEMINIKYLLIGDLDTNKNITEFSTNIIESKERKNAAQIFSKLCKSNERRFEERNRIQAKENCYYFTLYKPNIVFIIYVKSTYPERLIFAMIDEILNENILSMINEATKELNPLGRKELKSIIDKYQNKEIDKINEIQKDVNEIKTNLKENINKMVQNIDDVEKLQEKSNELKEASNDFKDNSHEIKRITCWQNSKLVILLIIMILIIVGIFLLMIFN